MAALAFCGPAGCSMFSSKSQGKAPTTTATVESDKADYRIATGDVLGIEVKAEKDCTGDYEVSKKGSITVCYLGTIEVEGKTPAQIAEHITRVLSEQYINHPEVKVEVKKFRGPGGWVKDSVRVLGEVNRPGIYTLKEGYMVLDVILEAGGFTEYASPNRTRIVRIEGDEKREIYVKVKDVMKSGDRTQDTVVRPGDTIVVPEGIL